MEDALREGTMLQGRAYRYRVERMLRQGSFGITYLARVELAGGLGRIDSNTFVAIKEFFMCDINGRQENTVTTGSQGGLYANYKRKFAREAENLSRINHPHIVKVLEFFEANNTVYYAMEYIDGGSLDERIAQRGGLTEAEGKAYARQIAEALAYMHAHKMLHLDLKPGNVMLRRSGEAVLIDFGLSKQYDENGNPESSTTVGGGTPGYAPIEQANYHEGKGFPVTMDVYALGATLFKMLTGVRPPDASTLFNEGFPAYELQKHRVSEGTIACVAKAMSPAVSQRYPSVTAFMAGLGNKVTDLGGQRETRQDTGEKRAEEKITEEKIKKKKTKASKKGSTLGGIGVSILIILALNILIRTPWSESPTANNATETAAYTHINGDLGGNKQHGIFRRRISRPKNGEIT